MARLGHTLPDRKDICEFRAVFGPRPKSWQQRSLAHDASHVKLKPADVDVRSEMHRAMISASITRPHRRGKSPINRKRSGRVEADTYTVQNRGVRSDERPEES